MIMNNTKLYMQPAAYAREHGELDAYRASFKANVACKRVLKLPSATIIAITFSIPRPS